MKKFEIVISKLEYENDRIEFYPPIKIDCHNNGSLNRCHVYFDFGLDTEIGISSFYLNLQDSVEEKTRQTLEFEIIHAFFHPYEDPNYTLLNWALYGNLKERSVIYYDARKYE